MGGGGVPHQSSCAPHRNPPLQPPQTRIRRQSQQRRRNRPRQHQPVIHTRHTPENQLAQSASPDRRRNRRHPDTSHRRRPQPRQDHARRQRQFDLGQPLPLRHPQRLR